MDNLYTYEKNGPFHVSVGAVLFNDYGEICLHKYRYEDVPGEVKHLTGGLSELYTLMRETVRDDESLVTAVLRGVKEEFGALGEVEKYLGALISNVDDKGLVFEKVTLYHSVRLQFVTERDKSDLENISELLWLSPQETLEVMERQVSQTEREELNEIKIIKNFIKLYETK